MLAKDIRKLINEKTAKQKLAAKGKNNKAAGGGDAGNGSVSSAGGDGEEQQDEGGAIVNEGGDGEALESWEDSIRARCFVANLGPHPLGHGSGPTCRSCANVGYPST